MPLVSFFCVWWFNPFILVGLVVYAQRKIDLGDFHVLLPPLFFWVAFNMLTFFKGLSLTSPISASVIMVSTPMIVLVLSAIIMKERLKKWLVGIYLD
jgi:drug/metabolite transporter (DMT)-like permease